MRDTCEDNSLLAMTKRLLESDAPTANINEALLDEVIQLILLGAVSASFSVRLVCTKWNCLFMTLHSVAFLKLRLRLAPDKLFNGYDGNYRQLDLRTASKSDIMKRLALFKENLSPYVVELAELVGEPATIGAFLRLKSHVKCAKFHRSMFAHHGAHAMKSLFLTLVTKDNTLDIWPYDLYKAQVSREMDDGRRPMSTTPIEDVRYTADNKRLEWCFAENFEINAGGKAQVRDTVYNGPPLHKDTASHVFIGFRGNAVQLRNILNRLALWRQMRQPATQHLIDMVDRLVDKRDALAARLDK